MTTKPPQNHTIFEQLSAKTGGYKQLQAMTLKMNWKGRHLINEQNNMPI